MHWETFYAVFWQRKWSFLLTEKRNLKLSHVIYQKRFQNVSWWWQRKTWSFFHFLNYFLFIFSVCFLSFDFFKKWNKNQIWKIGNRIHCTVERWLGANAAIIMDKYLSKDIWYTTHPSPTIILSFYAQKYSGDNHQQI